MSSRRPTTCCRARLNEPKLPLIPTQTQFMSTATPAGFEFVKDAQGKVTHLIVRGNVAERRRSRRNAAKAFR